MVCIDGKNGHKCSVVFKPFVGIAPRKYIRMFAIPTEISRKDKESWFIVDWKPEIATPRAKQFVEPYRIIEERAVKYLKKCLDGVASEIAQKRRTENWGPTVLPAGSVKLDEWLNRWGPAISTPKPLEGIFLPGSGSLRQSPRILKPPAVRIARRAAGVRKRPATSRNKAETESS